MQLCARHQIARDSPPDQDFFFTVSLRAESENRYLHIVFTRKVVLQSWLNCECTNNEIPFFFFTFLSMILIFNTLSDLANCNFSKLTLSLADLQKSKWKVYHISVKENNCISVLHLPPVFFSSLKVRYCKGEEISIVCGLPRIDNLLCVRNFRSHSLTFLYRFDEFFKCTRFFFVCVSDVSKVFFTEYVH